MLNMIWFRFLLLIGHAWFSLAATETLVETGWSEWSNWSECSRTCGRGLALQTRRCQHWQGCRGSTVRYNVCDLEDCPESTPDFYQEQCSAFDDDDKTWISANTAGSCSLLCQMKGSEDPPVELSAKVKDGTLCGEDFEGMCVLGECQKIGCDMILGSEKTVDACGLCGGDGSSCGGRTSKWRRRVQSPCSASCGGGYQILSAVCEDVNTRLEVPSDLCNFIPRPSPVVTSCGNKPCPAIWKTEAWSKCSSTCGTGYQLRQVYCAETKNSSITKLSDHSCLDPRPIHWRSCENKCPHWVEGLWQECSVTCGDGVRRRSVECRFDDGTLSNECNFLGRPNATLPCSTGTPCAPTQATLPEHLTSWIEDSDDSLYISGQHLHLEKQPVPAEPTFIASEWGQCSSSCGEGIRTRNVTCKIFLEFSRTIPELPDAQCPGQKPVTTKKCFVKDCKESQKSLHESSQRDIPIDPSSYAFSSMESSKGFVADSYPQSSSHLHPKITHSMVKEDTPAASKLQSSLEETPADDVNALAFPSPDSEELYHQNSVFFQDKFRHSNSIEPEKYHWKHAGFTTCTETCLGGVQESIYHCVRSKDHKRLDPKLCDLKDRPDSITRTCNDFPCPPRWEVGDFSPCSKTCGGGVTRREIKCVHQMTRSSSGTMVVPYVNCPQPAPYTQKYCNMDPCPPRWVAGKWSKCSASCGGGYRSRDVKCVQQHPLNKEEEKIGALCPNDKPSSQRKCARRSCDKKMRKRKRGPVIKTNPKQNYKQESYQKVVQLTIGGSASVFPDAKVKVRCPVRRFNRQNLTWWKDGKRILEIKGHIRVTRKGFLRIRSFQLDDEGLYVCKAGSKKADITIKLTTSMTPFGSIEENDSILGNDIYSTRFGIIGKKLSEPKGKKMTDVRENSISNSLDEGKDDFGTNTLQNFIYGRMNNRKDSEQTHRGVSLLSAALANGGLHQDLPPPTGDDKHVFGTIQKVSNNQPIEPNDEIYFGTMNHEIFVNHSVPGGDHVHSPGSARDHQERSAESPQQQLLERHSPFNFPDNGDPQNAPQVLGKGNRDSLEFEWKVANWTACSQTCSFSGTSGGYQIRTTQCIVKVENVSRLVDSALCLDAGLAGPPTIQRCGFDECPRWQVDDWSDCENSRCFTLHHALQKREIYCILHDGTKADLDQCDEVTKPHYKRECYNRKCVGVWHTGEWSKCTASCGGQGYRTRLLQCVWNGTKKSAGNACRELARPEVVRWCDGEPCADEAKDETPPSSSATEDCEDLSKYCRIVVRINMCKVKHYRQQCCKSCQ